MNTETPHGLDPARESLNKTAKAPPPMCPTTHEIEIHRLVPKGKDNPHYIAVCSCRRWRSDPFRARSDAVDKGLMHSDRGDLHNRALAAANYGKRPQIKTELQWYTDQANDPLNSDKDRLLWQNLADELADRMKGDGTEQSQLF